MPPQASRKSDHPLQVAVDLLGGQEALSRATTLSATQISQILHYKRPIPARHCLSVEKATNGAVTCHDLLPNVFEQPTGEKPHLRSEDVLSTGTPETDRALTAEEKKFVQEVLTAPQSPEELARAQKKRERSTANQAFKAFNTLAADKLVKLGKDKKVKLTKLPAAETAKGGQVDHGKPSKLSIKTTGLESLGEQVRAACSAAGVRIAGDKPKRAPPGQGKRKNRPSRSKAAIAAREQVTQ